MGRMYKYVPSGRSRVTYSKQKYRGRKGYRGKHAKLYKQIKSISLSQAETKMSNQKQVSNELAHNLTHYYLNLLHTEQGISAPVGTSQDSRNRIGSDVKGIGLRIKNQIVSAVGRPNCNYLIYVFWYRSSQTPTDTSFWSGPSGQGATNNRFLDHPLPGVFKIVKKIIIQNLNNYAVPIAGGTDSRVHTAYRETWIPLKLKNIRYDQDSEFPQPYTLGMAVTAFDANNTGQTDTLAYSSFSSTFYFKDP